MKGRLGRNLGLKAFALLLAYLLWAWVVGRSPIVKVVSIPVDVVAAPDVAVIDFEPREVGVRLEGDAATIKRISGGDLIARINAPRGVERRAKRTVIVGPQDVRGLPTGLGIEVRDSQVTVSLEPAVTRSLKVSVRTSGQLPAGYAVRRVASEPAVVNVTGPASLLKTLDHVSTDDVDVTGHRVFFSARSAIVHSDPHLRVEPESVRVLVDVGPSGEDPGTGESLRAPGGSP